MEQRLNDIEKRVIAVEQKLSNLPSKNDIDEIVRQAILDALLNTGKSTKAILITIATVLGALAIITGSFKAFLAFIGIGYLSK